MDEISVVKSAMREAGKILIEKLDHIQSVEFKGERDLVTEADRLSEKCIKEIISSAFPWDGILSEESGDRNEVMASAGSYSRLWVVDPLDGTTNFAHGLRFFAVSVALIEKGDLVLGAVLDPNTGEMVMAEAGSGTYTSDVTGDAPGALLGEKRVCVSRIVSLDRSLLATGFPQSLSRSKDNNLGHFANMSLRCQSVRRLGSAALALTYVALGRLDGYWEIGLSPWDVAAGSLLVREAGGMLSDFRGGRFDPFGKETVASNGLVHDELLSVLAMGHTGFSMDDAADGGAGARGEA